MVIFFFFWYIVRIWDDVIFYLFFDILFYSVGFKGDNIYEWRLIILGFLGFVYEGGVFFFDIIFILEYFFKFLKVRNFFDVC